MVAVLLGFGVRALFSPTITPGCYIACHLTSWQATTFLVGEHTQIDDVERNSSVRKLHVMKCAD
jgi:hypothetical protein